tara:strand:+ start:250 stop:657 length:408 start_codon:yes stop_codon:yes gene_type:complete
MSISSADIFKKVAIENGYEFDSADEDGWITYGFNMTRDSIEGNKSSQWLHYNTKNDKFSLNFSRTSTTFFGKENIDDSQYDLILKEVKEKCSYYNISNYGGTDFVTYSCSDSSYKGKIGFVIKEGQGIIRHFPPE